jgi:ferric iron reductase protein FhuF
MKNHIEINARINLDDLQEEMLDWLSTKEFINWFFDAIEENVGRQQVEAARHIRKRLIELEKDLEK